MKFDLLTGSQIIIKKQMVPFKSTAEEVSFEWSHHRILLTDSKVTTTLHVSIIDSGSEFKGPECISILIGPEKVHPVCNEENTWHNRSLFLAAPHFRHRIFSLSCIS